MRISDISMNSQRPSDEGYLAHSEFVALRRIAVADLPQIGRFGFTVSIVEPLNDLARLSEAFHAGRLWQDSAGAVAVVEAPTRRLIGTCQFYRAAPCIHGYELGYIIHDSADRSRGYGAQSVRLFSDYLFAHIPDFYRQQLVIEVWNTPSWKLAERCGFVREGLLRSSGLGSGDPADCFIYARTRKDWREQHHTVIGVG